MLGFPFFVRHAVNELAALLLAHRHAARVGRVLHPIRQAIATKAGEIHEIEVLHVGALTQMLDEAPESGCFEFGAGLIVHGRYPSAGYDQDSGVQTALPPAKCPLIVTASPRFSISDGKGT